MIERSQQMEVSILFKHGRSLKSIARETGMSINTVRKYVRDSECQRYKIRPVVVQKLAPYKDYIKHRLQTSAPTWVPATVLLREIREQGYDGGITRLRDFVASFKQTIVPKDKVVRFETDPGKQMQIDWAEFRKGQNRLAAFVSTLGFSRYSFVKFVEDEKIETLLSCHKEAFDFIGGVPQEILYDNMKTVVIERNAFGEGQHRFHGKLWDFAKHYGFLPRLCRPYRAKTKGKVERFIGYLRYSFYHPLSSRYREMGITIDKEAANVEVGRWLRDIANARIHGTTGQVPSERMVLEQPHLQRLPNDWIDCQSLPCNIDSIKRTPKAEAFLSQHDTTMLQHDLSVYDDLLVEVE